MNIDLINQNQNKDYDKSYKYTLKDTKYENWKLIIGITVDFFIYFLELVISI